jgi:hypothetical protein
MERRQKKGNEGKVMLKQLIMLNFKHINNAFNHCCQARALHREIVRCHALFVFHRAEAVRKSLERLERWMRRGRSWNRGSSALSALSRAGFTRFPHSFADSNPIEPFLTRNNSHLQPGILHELGPFSSKEGYTYTSLKRIKK